MPVLPRVAVVAAIYGLLFVALAAIVVTVAVGVGRSFKSLIEVGLPTIQARPAGDAQGVADAPQRPWAWPDQPRGHRRPGHPGLRDLSGDLVKPAADLALASLGIIGNLLMVVFLSLFILIDKDKIIALLTCASRRRATRARCGCSRPASRPRSAASCAGRPSRAWCWGWSRPPAASSWASSTGPRRGHRWPPPDDPLLRTLRVLGTTGGRGRPHRFAACCPSSWSWSWAGSWS